MSVAHKEAFVSETILGGIRHGQRVPETRFPLLGRGQTKAVV